MKKYAFYAGLAILLVGLVAGITLSNRREISPELKNKKTKVKALKGEFDIQNAFIAVADKTGKAIVTISTERTRKMGLRRPPFSEEDFGSKSPFRQDPFERFFEEFFGQLPEKEFKQRGLGSGVIIDKQGHILTNHHVVEGAEKINVTLPDGRSFEGSVKGADPRSDLAVVKINAKNLPVVRLGNSDLIQVGEWVVALGNPFGYALKSPKPTVTVGVISALHRRIPAPDGEPGYLDMIQTDAAINPGNSGGPLCDLNGRVIGINVAIFSTSGGYQGMGFAIPINSVKNILDDLIEGKEIAYGWLGVGVQEMTPELAEYFNIPEKKGALISQITPDSPAEKAGLKAGDIIKAFGGKKIDAVYDLLEEVSNAKIGQTFSINIVRDGIKKKLEVKISKRATKRELTGKSKYAVPEEIREWRGIRVIGITDEIARELGLKDVEGVAIVECNPLGATFAAGLRRGDVLREINKLRIRDLQDYKKLTDEAKGNVLVRTDKGYFIIKGLLEK